MAEHDLESIYREAQSALKGRDYVRASELLRQILQIDENYKDTSRLLAQMVKLRRRRWYNHPLLWGAVGAIVMISLGIWLTPKLREIYASQPLVPTVSPTTSPAATSKPTNTTTPTETPVSTPTSIPLTWRRISIGQEFERDTVTAIAIDPKDPEVLYASMKNAGIYKSINGGISWRPAHPGLSNTHVMSLLIDSQNPRILYAGTLGGIYKTEDGGENWNRIGEGTHVLMDPQDSSHLYARDGDSIYETTNQGHNWEAVYSSNEGCPGKIFLWAIHPTDGKKIFIDAGEECETGTYLSNDGGHTWTLIAKAGVFVGDGLAIGLDGQGDYYIYPFFATNFTFVPPGALGSVYYYWDSRLYKQNLNEEERLILGKPDVGVVTSITISPYDPNILYAGGEGLSVSKDGGLTWTGVNNGLGNNLLHLETRLGDASTFYLLSGECKEIQIQSYEGGTTTIQALYVSNNSGTTWDMIPQTGCNLIKDAAGSTLYRTGESEDWIWRSQDGGGSWQGVTMPRYIQTIVAHTSQTGLLYGFTHNPYHQNRVNPYFPEEEYYYSEDFGNTWKKQEPPVSTKPCYGSKPQFIDKYRPQAIDPFDGNHVLVIDGRLLESHDSCDTTETFATHPNSSMNSIAFDPNNPDTLYAGTDGGAYVSADGGQTWGQVNDGLLGATVVYSIVVDKDSNVYAATPYGIFKLENK
jgi:photosystem II stability/assembly factor-like uncharacterized protein